MSDLEQIAQIERRIREEILDLHRKAQALRLPGATQLPIEILRVDLSFLNGDRLVKARERLEAKVACHLEQWVKVA